MRLHLRSHPAFAVWITGLLLLAAPTVRAGDLLPIALFDSPLILSFNGSLTYTAASGQFHSDTIPLAYNLDGLPDGFAFFEPGGLTSIDLFVDMAGQFVASGTGLRVTGALDLDGDGTIDVSGGPANPLLFGPITAFGADPPGPPSRTFNGLFDVEGGALTGVIPLSGGGSLFGGYTVGVKGGFFVFAENVTGGILADFRADFSSSLVKSTVGVVIPEPGAVALFLLGAAALTAYGLARRRTAPGHHGSAAGP
jgi:hypothetical protein